MACYKPLRAYRGVRDRAIYWRKVNDSDEISLPCGQCIGCRIERSRQWAARCMHEAKMHKHNSFLTLTLKDEHLTNKYFTGRYFTDGRPAYAGTLNKRDAQLFWKRLRKKLSVSSNKMLSDPDRISKLRYYLGGEYGEKYGRPHYHACLFGIDFADKKYHCKSPAGEKLYRSETLEKLWPQGFSTIGNVTFESAAYVARYIMKKINGKQKEKHYEKIDQETGEIIKIEQEYNNMSRRPGIGLAFLQKYQNEIYPKGKIITRGHESNAPRYYDKQYKKIDPYGYEDLKTQREQELRAQWYEQTHERLQVREKVAEAKIKHLKRTL